MSDKLTISVASEHECHRVELKRDHHVFLMVPKCPEDQVDFARLMADWLTEAIDGYDAAVNAELIGQRDRLLEVCKAVRAMLDVPEMLDDTKELLHLAIVKEEKR